MIACSVHVDLPFQVHHGLNNLTIFFNNKESIEPETEVLTFTMYLEANFLMLTLCRPNLYRCLKTSQNKKKCNLKSQADKTWIK